MRHSHNLIFLSEQARGYFRKNNADHDSLEDFVVSARGDAYRCADPRCQKLMLHITEPGLPKRLIEAACVVIGRHNRSPLKESATEGTKNEKAI